MKSIYIYTCKVGRFPGKSPLDSKRERGELGPKGRSKASIIVIRGCSSEPIAGERVREVLERKVGIPVENHAS